MTDQNPTKAKPMAAHRQAEADVLCSPEFKAAMKRHGFELVGYRELCAQGPGRPEGARGTSPYGQSDPATTKPATKTP